MYRTSTSPISEECFGEWMNDDFDFMHNFFKELYNFRVPYDDAKKFANDVVDGMYKNHRACQFGKVYHDLDQYCGDDKCDDKVWENIQNNLFVLFGKI